MELFIEGKGSLKEEIEDDSREHFQCLLNGLLFVMTECLSRAQLLLTLRFYMFCRWLLLFSF